MAKYDIELAEYDARLNQTRCRIKEERNLTIIPKNTEELLVNVKDRLRKLSCSVKAEQIKKTNDVSPAEITVISHERNSFANELTWIKENIERINKVMDKLSENEARRVTDIYKTSPCEVGLAHIFKVLVGAKARDYMKFTQI